MKLTYTTIAFFLSLMIFTALLVSCNPEPPDVDLTGEEGTPQPVTEDPTEPAPDEPIELGAPVEPVQTAQPLIITIDESVDRTEEPPLHLYLVTVENLTVSPDEEVGIHFVYELTQPTGEATYLLNDPMDPDSGVVTDANGEVIYRIVETVEKRIEDWGNPEQTQRSYVVEFPSTVYKIRYWVEVVTRRMSEIEEKEIMDVPYITVDEMIMQGGQIQYIPE